MIISFHFPFTDSYLHLTIKPYRFINPCLPEEVTATTFSFNFILFEKLTLPFQPCCLVIQGFSHVLCYISNNQMFQNVIITLTIHCLTASQYIIAVRKSRSILTNFSEDRRKSLQCKGEFGCYLIRTH